MTVTNAIKAASRTVTGMPLSTFPLRRTGIRQRKREETAQMPIMRHIFVAS